MSDPVTLTVSAKKIKEISKDSQKLTSNIPKYSIVERSSLSFENCTSEVTPKQKVPESLVIRVELPGVSSAKGIDVDLQEQTFRLKCEKFKLENVSLPFNVDKESGKCKFYVDKQLFELVVSVLKTP